MSIVERYHNPLRRSFSIIRSECPKIDFDNVLLAAVKSLNDSTGSGFLVPTLLDFGALPRLGTSQDPPHPDMAKRAATVSYATKEMSK